MVLGRMFDVRQEVDEKCCGEYLTEPRLSPRAGEIRGDHGESALTKMIADDRFT
jgi:hypothetical protein